MHFDDRQRSRYPRGMDQNRRMAIERLERLMVEKGFDMKSLSLAAGLNDSYVRDVLKRGRGGKLPYLKKLAEVLGVPVSYITDGTPAPKSDALVIPFPRVQPVIVRGQTQAGSWMEFDDASFEYDPIPSIPKPYNGDQFAFRVVGNSMTGKRIHHGDYVICVDYWQNVKAPREGDIVVVERRRGHLFERTVKEMVVKPDHMELWPRSDDPHHQAPLIVPLGPAPDETDEHVEIVGLVVAIHVPL